MHTVIIGVQFLICMPVSKTMTLKVEIFLLSRLEVSGQFETKVSGV